MKPVFRHLTLWIRDIRTRITGFPRSKSFRNTRRTVTRHPLLTFFGLLIATLILIILGTILENANRPQEEVIEQVRSVRIYRIGALPTITLQAKIEKAGVVKIIAQSAGIVQKINYGAGSVINRGQAVVSMSSNAAGADAGSLQAALAGKQFQLASQTLVSQKEIIAKQRDVAEKSSENTEELRKISESSLNDTRDLLNQNRDLLNDLNDQIELLESAPLDPDTESTLTQLIGQRNQLSGGVAQLQGQVRNLEYSTNAENPPTELADLQKDITLKQLDLQEKTLTLQKELAGIQSALAQVQASLMHPASPFNGVVERVNVKVGQAINPGTVIATVSSNDQSLEATVLVPASIAQNVSRLTPSRMVIDDTPIEIFPKYISTNATDGQLYSIIYCPPEEYTAKLTDQSYISIDIPIGGGSVHSVYPFVPIDAVFQSQDTSSVYIVNGNKAEVRTVILGDVYGQYVSVKQGLSQGDIVILNRNIVKGDTIRITQ